MNYPIRIQETISKDIRRTLGPLRGRVVGSMLIPLLVFMGLMIGSGYVRVWVAATFEANSLNLTTAISTSLVVIVVATSVLQRLEKRYRGWAALRGLVTTLAHLSRLETAIRNEADGLEDLADVAWAAYQSYLTILDIEAPSLL